MKRLIIAPHADDDVLGCGGILDHTCHVVYCGLDESGIDNRPEMDERISEINKVQSITNHTFEVLDNLVNRYEEYKLISQIENIINHHKPNEVYVCHPSYNQDHKSVYNATMISLRPHDTNYFVEIDIDKKIKVYETMKSQVRSFRSFEHLRSNAKIRGGQSNCEYAEAFEIIRWVNG